MYRTRKHTQLKNFLFSTLLSKNFVHSAQINILYLISPPPLSPTLLPSTHYTIYNPLHFDFPFLTLRNLCQIPPILTHLRILRCSHNLSFANIRNFQSIRPNIQTSHYRSLCRSIFPLSKVRGGDGYPNHSKISSPLTINQRSKPSN